MGPSPSAVRVLKCRGVRCTSSASRSEASSFTSALSSSCSSSWVRINGSVSGSPHQHDLIMVILSLMTVMFLAFLIAFLLQKVFSIFARIVLEISRVPVFRHIFSDELTALFLFVRCALSIKFSLMVSIAFPITVSVSVP